MRNELQDPAPVEPTGDSPSATAAHGASGAASDATRSDPASDAALPSTAAAAAAPAQSEVPAVVADAVPIADPLVELQSQLTKTKDSWIRAAADLENYRRRARRDQLEAVQRAENEVVLLFLPVMDNLERALGHAAQASAEGQQGALLEGLRMVERQFLGVLARCGIEAQQTVGSPFDPQRHEAIQQQPTEQPAGTVVAELQKGYLRQGRLVRPAMVVVSSGPPAGAVPAAGVETGAEAAAEPSAEARAAVDSRGAAAPDGAVEDAGARAGD